VPETLPYQIDPNCPIGADVRQDGLKPDHALTIKLQHQGGAGHSSIIFFGVLNCTKQTEVTHETISLLGRFHFNVFAFDDIVC